MNQELPFDEFNLIISTTKNNNDLFSINTFLNFDLFMHEQHLCNVPISTPIKTLEDLQKSFDFVMVQLGVEFCKMNELSKYYEHYSPHIKEILSNYCIRENNDEDIKDINLLYIRSKFLETT